MTANDTPNSNDSPPSATPGEWDQTHLQSGTNSRTGGLLTLLGTVVLFLLLFGGGGYLFYELYSENRIFLENQPALVVAATREIAEIEIPAPFQPHQTLSLSEGFKPVMTQVDYELPAGDGELRLTQYGRMSFTSNALVHTSEQQLQNFLSDRGDREIDLAMIASQTRDFEIRGQTVPFHFLEAENRQTGERFYAVAGAFSEKQTLKRNILLTLRISADHYDEQAVIHMIESIR